MAINYAFIIKRLRSLKEVHAAYAVATNMPFVTCDEESFNDQVWLFTSLEAVQEFAKQYEAQRIGFKGVRIPQDNMPEFYMDLHSMGVNEIVFCEGSAQHKLELDKLVKLPDFSKVPEKQRPLMNQELQLSTAYFMQEARRPGAEPDKEKLEELAEEVYVNLAKARFLMPVQMESTGDNKGKINLPYITDPKGNKFQPIFSDHSQYVKHVKHNKPSENTRVLLVGIAELQRYLLSNVQGYMLNPDGYCHVLAAQQLKFISDNFMNKPEE